MNANTLIKIVLGLAIIGLTYWLVEIVMEPIRFQKEKAQRYEAVKEKLLKIKDAQVEFKNVNSYFASSFEELAAFIDTGFYPIIERRDSTYEEYDEIYQQMVSKDMIIVDTLSMKPVMGKLFPEGYDLKQLAYIPYSEQVTFDMDAASIDRNGVSVPVFELSAPNSVILKGLSENFYDPDYRLKIGSLTEANISGNWN